MMSAGQLEPLSSKSVKINRVQKKKKARFFSKFQSALQEQQQHREQKAKVWQIDGHPQGVCQRYCTRASWKLLIWRAF
jgi:hypothetical protein